MGPGDRVFHAMAFDESRARVVLFGGSTAPVGGDGNQAAVRGDTWEQFEEGRASGGGAGAVELESITVDPNPAPADGTVIITVTLTAPAPDVTNVDLSIDDVPFASLGIAAGELSGTFELPLPGLPEGPNTVTARLGTSEISTTLEIQGGGGTVVDVVSVDADPNPVAPGETLVITVTIAVPVPVPARVQLLADGQPFGEVLITAMTTIGSLSLSIQPGTAPIEFTLTARSGQTEASVQVTIQ
jgi:hypothetical protein